MKCAHVETALELLSQVESADLAQKIDLFDEIHANLKLAVSEASL